MRLWIVSTAHLWEDVQQSGSLSFESFDAFYATYPDVLEFEEWKPYYEWLGQEMARRIPSQRGHILMPWFAYAQFRIDHQRPDARALRHWYKGQELEVLELEVPDSEVLLIDDNAWMMFVSGQPVTYSEAEYDAWHALHDDAVIQKEPERIAAYLAARSHRLFEAHRVNGGDWATFGQGAVFGIFGVLRSRDVIRVSYYPRRRTFTALSERPTAAAPTAQ